MNPETEIQKAILNYLKLRRVLHWRQSLGGVRRRGGTAKNPMKGFPDIAGVRGGKFFAIEVKHPERAGDLSEKQIEWRDSLVEHGTLYILATSVDDVSKAFDQNSGACDATNLARLRSGSF